MTLLVAASAAFGITYCLINTLLTIREERRKKEEERQAAEEMAKTEEKRQCFGVQPYLSRILQKCEGEWFEIPENIDAETLKEVLRVYRFHKYDNVTLTGEPAIEFEGADVFIIVNKNSVLDKGADKFLVPTRP